MSTRLMSVGLIAQQYIVGSIIANRSPAPAAGHGKTATARPVFRAINAGDDRIEILTKPVAAVTPGQSAVQRRSLGGGIIEQRLPLTV